MSEQTSSGQDMLAKSVREFVAAAAAKTPTPGGGSVAGVVGALGVALGEMALNFTRGKKKYAQHEAFHEHLGQRLEKARQMFLDLVGDDMAAYNLYQETAKQPQGPQRDAALQVAVSAAISVPREMTKLSLAVLEDLLSLADKCNPWLISDLAAAAALAAATVRLCDYNVRINVPQVSDPQAAQMLRQFSRDDLARANQLLDEIEKVASEHLK